MKSKFCFFAVCGIFVFAGAVFTGCDRKPSTKNAVAVVNGSPIGNQEFEKELKLRVSQDPSFKPTAENIEDQLNLLINRKLLIEEAIDRRLDQADRFTTSIRIFWEQTLIRLLMDSLSEEFEQTTSASEEEIRDYYAKLAYKVSFEIKRNKDETSATNRLAAAKNGDSISWDEKLGPVTFDELSSSVLQQAFELKSGEYGIYERDGVFFLIHLLSKETAAAPPLDAIWDKIKGKIKLRKQTAAFEEWFKEKKRKADIKTNLANLDKRSAYGLSQSPQS